MEWTGNDHTAGDLLRVGERVDGEVLVVSAQGDVDLASAAHLRARLVHAVDTASGTAPARGVVADFRGVTFLSAVGMAVLAEADSRAMVRGTSPRVVVRDSCPAARVLRGPLNLARPVADRPLIRLTIARRMPVR